MFSLPTLSLSVTSRNEKGQGAEKKGQVNLLFIASFLSSFETTTYTYKAHICFIHLNYCI